MEPTGLEPVTFALPSATTPPAMAAADESFYKDVVRAGYRGPYLHALAADVAEGRLDLEALNDAGLPDEEVATIERRFRRYREYAGLAFWLYLTRDWVDERPI